jgi:hypothetical protein
MMTFCALCSWVFQAKPFCAMHVRRGDKTHAKRKEAQALPMSAYLDKFKQM